MAFNMRWKGCPRGGRQDAVWIILTPFSTTPSAAVPLSLACTCDVQRSGRRAAPRICSAAPRCATGSDYSKAHAKHGFVVMEAPILARNPTVIGSIGIARCVGPDSGVRRAPGPW